MIRLLIEVLPYAVLAIPPIAIIARIFAPERKRGEYNHPAIRQEVDRTGHTGHEDCSGGGRYCTYENEYTTTAKATAIQHEINRLGVLERFGNDEPDTSEDRPVSQPGIAVEMPARVTPDSVFAKRGR